MTGVEIQWKKKINPTTLRKLFRLILRYLPILPGPEIYDLFVDIKRSRTDLDKQVETAIESLQLSTQLIDQLENNLQERAIKLGTLRDEYERYSELAEIEENKVGALVQQLEITLGKDRKKERAFSILLTFLFGLIFFLAGIFLSTPIINLF